jgi:hypothetical protein
MKFDTDLVNKDEIAVMRILALTPKFDSRQGYGVLSLVPFSEESYDTISLLFREHY